ncbi:hypothetical protein [Mycobacterium sp. GA-2829]|uniref:hypothetical protein n=1 Tax=Mycobacterium sp. GA-2829 TaxID=1772283 RepID=UPI00073FE6EF|nr:hypothetical protein [Mycobacterium sp. GA-2829]KUI36219.1 hypothetical protein AU194_16010 [Mycobacterium sp. GA-2829]
MTQNRVGESELYDTANRLDELKFRAIDTLNRYMNHSTDVHSSGVLQGSAGGTNVVTAEEIKNAQDKISDRWDQVIQVLRESTSGFVDQDSQNASNIASVASDLRFT